MNISDFENKNEFAKANAFFPLLDLTGEYLAERGHLRGVRLGWHCHLTTLTAISAKALAKTGCKVTLSECNPATSDAEAIEYMRELGFKTFTGPSSVEQTLAEGIDVVSDTGFDLLSHWLSSGSKQPIFGACEITTSGISRLRELKTVPTIPVVNINDGQIKMFVENFHGVGDGLIEALKVLTGCAFQGQSACVVGYGRVGAGVAHYLHRAGLQVTVVEPHPVRRLVAHFDGFAIGELNDVLPTSSLLVTATGMKGLLTEENWRHAADGLLAINVGHWREELSLDVLAKISSSGQSITEHLDEFVVDGKRIRVAVHGDPCNVALLTGSIEPTLIHLAVELLSLEYLILNKGKMKNGELRVPEEVESAVATLALRVSSRK